MGTVFHIGAVRCLKSALFVAVLVSLAMNVLNASSAPGAASGVKPAEGTGSSDERCKALASLDIEGGEIVSAGLLHDPAAFKAVTYPNAEKAGSRDQATRPFCQVKALWSQVPDAAVRIQIWLPVPEDWNGKFFGTSNGGLEEIVQAELAGGVARGYATASMEFGQGEIQPDIYRIGIDNPELVKNWVYRGVHAMTVISKQVVTAFYNRKPSVSIFGGSSGAGFEAIGEARRYPDDYDGIIAGWPAINYANMGFSQGYKYVLSHRSATSDVPSSLLPHIAGEILAQCDGLDGLRDGIIDDPRRCRVNFQMLACKPDGGKNCLHPDQVATLEAIYDGLRDPRTGEVIYPGFTPGAELSAGAQARLSNNSATSFINDDTPGPLIWVLGAKFSAKDWMTFDFGRDADKYRTAFSQYENSHPDLSAFAARGGKIIFHTGWAESNLNPVDLVNFYEDLRRKAGGSDADKFSRLFMAPGMYHFGGGPGPNSFGQKLAVAGSGPDDDLIMAIDRWITSGIAPERIIATKFQNDEPSGRVLRRRPLCAYPKVARWNGVGNIDDAQQFRCVDP